MNTNLKSISEKLDRISQAIHAWHTDPLTGEPLSDITEEQIRQDVQYFAQKQAPEATDIQIENTALKLIKILLAEVEIGTVITGDEFEPWLDEARPSIAWTRWRAYKKLLSKKKRSADVLNKLDSFTDEVLELAGNPLQEGSWARKGLLIGDVQSGKTQNYLALINKAADAGYRLVVILAGNTEYLRRQTQERVDEGFLGRDTQILAFSGSAERGPNSMIGVGLIDKRIHLSTQSLTTMSMDFLEATKRGISITVSENSTEPFVFVVKKNKFVLEALEGWAQSLQADKSKVDVPLLLLDDESDYASVNTKDESENPTAINSAIRSLLNRFERSSYLAITATPFANIFVDPESEMDIQKNDDTSEKVKDLFPSDYIYGLEAPSSYVGIKKIFGSVDDPVDDKLRYLDDDAFSWLPTNHKISDKVRSLPESLRQAIRTYVIVNAIMDLNGSATMRRSMLVNVSRFTPIQKLVGTLVSSELTKIKDALEIHGEHYLSGKPNSIIEQLHEVFIAEYETDCGYSWQEVAEVLHASASLIRVKVYNSDPDRIGVDLEFEPDVPARQIAVGGDLLSRGLTLDNLVISYFHRAVRAADTMMQMARWFGYRDGYEELCRVWLSKETTDNYRFVGDAVEELRGELRLMKAAGRTPEEFGLAVQESPESLLITARNKQRHAVSGEKIVDLRGQRLETTKLSDNILHHVSNQSSIYRFINHLSDNYVSELRDDYKWPRFNHVDRGVIASLLSEYKAGPSDIYFDEQALPNMIETSSHPSFGSWDVVFVEGERSSDSVSELKIGKIDLALPMRMITFKPYNDRASRHIKNRGKAHGEGELHISGKSSRLAGRTDLQAMMSPAVIEKVRAEVKVTNLSEDNFYEHLPRPILFVYLLLPQTTPVERDRAVDPITKKTVVRLKKGEPVNIQELDFIVALKIALPKPPNQGKHDKSGRGKYLMNKVAQRYGFMSFSPWSDFQ